MSSFEPKHLDQLPDVLVDLIKSYIDPELQLAEVGIACEDPKISNIMYAWPEWVDNHSIFLKKWTKMFDDGRILICNPKWLVDDFDRKSYINEVERHLVYYNYPRKCNECDFVLIESDKVWIISHAIHLRWTSPDDFLVCESCVSDYYDNYELLATKTIKVIFHDSDRKNMFSKMMKVHILEPHNSPISVFSVLTEVSGFNVRNYLMGRHDGIVQISQSESVDEWTDRIAAEVLGSAVKK